jgi:hypothetical protein
MHRRNRDTGARGKKTDIYRIIQPPIVPASRARLFAYSESAFRIAKFASTFISIVLSSFENLFCMAKIGMYLIEI